jgi:hypothetical protein
MSKLNLTTLNETLGDVIQRLMDGNDPSADAKDTISIERAKAINEMAQTIVASAKVQSDVITTVIKHGGKESIKKASVFFTESEVKQISE